MLHCWSASALALGLCALLDACRAAPQSSPPTPRIDSLQPESLLGRGRPLQGRFLHITDFHPDPFFKTYSSTEENAACHRKHGPAGLYGAETSGCDSPYSLVNETFNWIKKHVKDDIDFIIWTGDSARHDNDEKIPRTQKQVIEQNEFIVSKFGEVFSSEHGGGGGNSDFSIPIVPTFGNNDIMPHNIFLAGPNKWTMKYLDIWRGFIPEEQRHQFQQGGWFYREVVPGRLAVFSLNTMYFFASNSGVDGCASKKEPGYEHMEWLRIQLQILRERGMKAMLIGHVPPARVDSKSSWDETCWQKFTLWERQFRDVIVGSFFGHMNIDHFMLEDFKDLKKGTKNGRMKAMSVQEKEVMEGLLDDGEVTVASASDYIQDLGDVWSKLPAPPAKNNKESQSIDEYLDSDDEGEDEDETFSIWTWITNPFGKSKKGGKGGKDKGDNKKQTKKKYLKKIGGRYAERYSVTHVSPSVVPNYFPTLRIYTYNISGLENSFASSDLSSWSQFPNPSTQSPILTNTEPDDLDLDYSNDEAYNSYISAVISSKQEQNNEEPSSLKKKTKHKKKKKYKFTVPSAPSKSSPPGPAYSPQTFTLLGYTQWFANLTRINNDFVENSLSSSYSTTNNVFGLRVCLPSGEEEDNRSIIEPARWKEGKHNHHQGKKPRPGSPHPKKFVYEVEYNTWDKNKGKGKRGWGMKDLTVRRYVDLARRIGGDKHGKHAKSYEEFDEEEDEDVVDWDEEDWVEGDELEAEERHKKKKKGKKHKGKKGGAWYTFVQRAFVGTLDSKDIKSLYSIESSGIEGDVDGNMEL